MRRKEGMLDLFNSWEKEIVKESLEKGKTLESISSMLSNKTVDDCRELALLNGWISNDIVEKKSNTNVLDLGIESLFREKKLLEIANDFIFFYNKGVTNSNVLLREIEGKYNLPKGYGSVLQNLIWGGNVNFRCIMRLQKIVKGIKNIDDLEIFISNLRKEILEAFNKGQNIQQVSKSFIVEDRLIYSFLQREFGTTDVEMIKKLGIDFKRPTVYKDGEKQEYIEKLIKKYTYVSKYKEREIPEIEGMLFEETPESYDENELFKRHGFSITMQDYYDILGISKPKLNFEYLDYLLRTKKTGVTLKTFISKNSLKDYTFLVELRAKLLGREMFNFDVDYFLIEDIIVENLYGKLGDLVSKLISYFIPQEYYKPIGYYSAVAFEKQLDLETHPSFISIEDFEKVCIAACAEKGVDITTLTPWYSKKLCEFLAGSMNYPDYSMDYYLKYDIKPKVRRTKVNVNSESNLKLSEQQVYKTVLNAIDIFDKCGITYDEDEKNLDIYIGKDKIYIDINTEILTIWGYLPYTYDCINKSIKEYTLTDFDTFWTYEKDELFEGVYRNLDYETWDIHKHIEGSTVVSCRERARLRGFKRGYTEKEEEYNYNELVRIGDIQEWSESIGFRTPKALEMRIKDEYCLMAIKEVKELREKLAEYESNLSGITAENFYKINQQIREELEPEIRSQERQNLIDTSGEELLKIKQERIQEKRLEIDVEVEEIGKIYKAQREQEILKKVNSYKFKRYVEIKEKNRILESIDKVALKDSVIEGEKLKILSEIDRDEIKKSIILDLEKEVYQEIINEYGNKIN